MGLTLQGLGALGSGAVEGHGDFITNRAKRDETSRDNAEENRTARNDQFEQVYRESMQKRPDSSKIQQAPPPPPTQGIPTGPGGQGIAPPQGGGMGPPEAPAGAALPTGGAPAQAAPQFSSRREEYQHWLKNSENAAMMAGGLEGLELFKKSENLNSMREMQTWGEQGVRALQNNSPVDAARFFNTMFEVSPNDFGLEAEAFDGKLYLKGQDGKRGSPIGQAEAMSYMDSFLTSPDNFLAVQEKNLANRKQDETERAAGVTEKQEDAKIDVWKRGVSVEEGGLDLKKKFAERGMQVDEANALANMISASAQSERAANSVLRGLDNGWTNSEITSTWKMVDAWALDDLAWDEETDKFFMENPNAWTEVKRDVKHILYNSEYGTVTPEEAASVSRLIRGPEGVKIESLDKDAKFHLGKDGRSIGMYIYGKMIPLDPGMYADIEDRFGFSFAGEAAKADQTGQVDQTGKTGPAALPPSEADRQRALAAAQPPPSLDPLAGVKEIGGILSIPFKKRSTPRHADEEYGI